MNKALPHSKLTGVATIVAVSPLNLEAVRILAPRDFGFWGAGVPTYTIAHLNSGKSGDENT